MTDDVATADDRAHVVRALVVVFGFSVALGGTSVVYPLLALDAGHPATIVGLLTSISAAAQLTARMWLPWLLSVVPDRTIISAASLTMAISATTLLGSGALAVFVVAQILQGAARALFWTSSQSHLVRSSGSAVNRLAQVGIASKVGALVGPALAGTIAAISLSLALWVTVIGGVLASAASLLMVRRPPYVRDPREKRQSTWRRRDLAAAYWTGFASGGWRGLLDSYVPVVLSGAGLSASVVGWLFSLTEGSHLVASTWLAKAREVHLPSLVRIAGVGVLVGSVTLHPLASQGAVFAAVALAIAGACGGLAATVGPALANEQASAGEQGTVLAVTGAYRSAGRMLSPSAVSGLAGPLGTPFALGLTALGVVAPSLAIIGPRQRESASRDPDRPAAS